MFERLNVRILFYVFMKYKVSTPKYRTYRKKNNKRFNFLHIIYCILRPLQQK